jgi:hypothetical protein
MQIVSKSKGLTDGASNENRNLKEVMGYAGVLDWLQETNQYKSGKSFLVDFFGGFPVYFFYLFRPLDTEELDCFTGCARTERKSKRRPTINQSRQNQNPREIQSETLGENCGAYQVI